ncbi:hypothetical protein [Undibacterium parvum]|uniref:Uncharacterized protein n=1 Tax=Undibacterium parvum TaxID=401471 RepID=A0A3S9HFN7_9BURK|nr:hypothetical protein [Undibacterium parvum]AZP10928.1 hypothetical protein EJN92_02180 [Undibacterium parvum]
MRHRIPDASAQLDIDQLCSKDKLNKKPRSFSNQTLAQHAALILAWAKARGSSKRKVSRLILQKLGLSTSPDQVYRFVKSINGGIWPHKKTRKVGDE